MSEEQELEEKTFLLPAEVQFGYLPVCSSHVEVNENTLMAHNSFESSSLPSDI